MHSFTNLEQKKHGTSTFPAEYFYVDNNHLRYQMPLHWHNDWELLHIRRGSMQVQLDNIFFEVNEGDVVLVRGGVLHGSIPRDCIYDCFVFDLHGLFCGLDSVKEYLRPFYRQNLLPQHVFTPAEHPDICRIAKALMDTYRDPIPTSCPELDAIACLGRIFSLIHSNKLYTAAPESADGLHRIDQIKSVLEYIDANYAADLSLQTLSSIVGITPKYFCRIFSFIMHQSPMDYVNSYRIERATFLLDSSSKSITTVGMECGYPDSSYFTKVFKKYKGVSPKQYRKAGAVR